MSFLTFELNEPESLFIFLWTGKLESSKRLIDLKKKLYFCILYHYIFYIRINRTQLMKILEENQEEIQERNSKNKRKRTLSTAN